MRQVHVVTDLQFGSTGKGLFSGWLAKRVMADTVVSAWGPNAGHTFVNKQGQSSVHIMLPVGVVAPSVKRVLIGPGSVIDAKRLLDELTAHAFGHGAGEVLAIHENAMVLNPGHADLERQYGHVIGSTMKGNGEAVIEKISRRHPGCVAGRALRGTPLEGYLVGVEDYNDLMDKAEVLVVEGAQGFSLSINQGFYPYTTSRDCTTAQILNDCAVPMNRFDADCGSASQEYQLKVYGVARTYPIRVANRFGADGQMIGTSGPCYWDQQEIKWAAIGREPELTTVTKLPRRLFTFSGEQVKQAIRMNGVDEVFLNFCNYVEDPLELTRIVAKIEAAGAPVKYTGWGEREDQITHGNFQLLTHKPAGVA